MPLNQPADFKDWGSNPFEILIPESLADSRPDLRIASRFLDLLRSSPEQKQFVEINSTIKLALSNNPDLRQFLTLVNGAGQVNSFNSQVRSMLFPTELQGAMGQLHCLVMGRLVSFAITEISPSPFLRWEITRASA